MIRRLKLTDRIADNGANGIRGSRHSQGEPCQDQGRSRAKHDRRGTKNHHRTEKNLSLPSNLGQLRDHERRNDSARRLRRGQPSIFYDPHMQNVTGNDGHQRICRSKERRHEIQQHRGNNDGFADNKVDAFFDRAPGHTRDAIGLCLRNRPDEEEGNDHRQIGQGIEVIHGFLPSVGNDKTGERRTDDRTGLPGDGCHAEGVRQVFCRNQVRDQCLA